MNYLKNYNDYVAYVKNEVKLGNRPRTKQTKKHFNGYWEFHHIIPKSLGGDNSEDNLIPLTAREHFLAHYLLTKIYSEGVAHSKMVFAFIRCCNGNEPLIKFQSSRLYEKIKLELDSQRGERIKQWHKNNPELSKAAAIKMKETRTKNGSYGKMTDETKAKVSSSLHKYYEENPEAKEKLKKQFKGIWNCTEEQKQKYYEAKAKSTYRPSDETKAKIIESNRKNSPFAKKIICVETNEEFYSISDLARKLEMPRHKVGWAVHNNSEINGNHYIFKE